MNPSSPVGAAAPDPRLVPNDPAAIEPNSNTDRSALNPQRWKIQSATCRRDLIIKAIFYTVLIAASIGSLLAVTPLAMEAVETLARVDILDAAMNISITGYPIGIAYVVFNILHPNPSFSDWRDYSNEKVARKICQELKTLELRKIVERYSLSVLSRYGYIDETKEEGTEKLTQKQQLEDFFRRTKELVISQKNHEQTFYTSADSILGASKERLKNAWESFRENLILPFEVTV